MPRTKGKGKAMHDVATTSSYPPKLCDKCVEAYIREPERLRCLRNCGTTKNCNWCNVFKKKCLEFLPSLESQAAELMRAKREYDEASAQDKADKAKNVIKLSQQLLEVRDKFATGEAATTATTRKSAAPDSDSDSGSDSDSAPENGEEDRRRNAALPRRALPLHPHLPLVLVLQRPPLLLLLPLATPLELPPRLKLQTKLPVMNVPRATISGRG
ncbi:hypothetical protein KEM55_007764, partial [Ascosphaera atra]